MRLLSLSIAVLAVVVCVTCRKAESPVIVHVYRDWSKAFAEPLRQADLQFAMTGPHLRNGKSVMIATLEGHSLGFTQVLGQLDQSQPALLVLNEETDIPDSAIKQKLGNPTWVCGGHPAYIADWVAGERREAARMYLDFLSTHCGGTPIR